MVIEMSNGEMITELRRMAAQKEIDYATALQLLMAAQADMLERLSAHKHGGEYATCDHDHDDLYAGRLHEHPFAYLVAGISALAAAAAGVFFK